MARALRFFLIFLVSIVLGCGPIPRIEPPTPDPPYGGVVFVQSGSTTICSGCTQQNFQVTLPNVGDGDTAKVVVWWFSSYQVGNNIVQPPNPVVTDSANSAYSLITSGPNCCSPSQMGYMFSTPSVSSGGNDVTFTIRLPFPTQNLIFVVVLEYSGGGTLDGQANWVDTFGPSPATSAPVTVTGQDVVISLYFGSLFGTTACATCNLRFVGSSEFVVQDFFPTGTGSMQAQFSNTNRAGLYAVGAASFQ